MQSGPYLDAVWLDCDEAVKGISFERGFAERAMKHTRLFRSHDERL